MKTIYYLALGLFFSTHLLGQNAFSFDGVDDYGAAANGSSQIANASGISLSMWVYPKTMVSGYPNFGGMAGFRNESNCDFYLLQLNNNNVEARLRNSSGTIYTITYNGGMTLNTWNHFVLVYNGSNLILYHDGAQASSISASGSITSMTTPFNVGYVPFGGANFHFDGDVDDCALWDKALSASQVTALYNSCGYDLSDANLKIAYEFNQGVAGGSNATISSFTDSKGSYNATISGAALSGTSSNFIAGISSNFSDSLTVDACNEYISPTGMLYTSSGMYTDSLISSTGCDSIFYIDLTVNYIDSSISVSGITLSSNDTSSTAIYQWIDCNTGQAISGVTGRTFTPTLSGTYGLIVQNGNCIDTSECYTVNVSGIGLNEPDLKPYKLYPNPTQSVLWLEAQTGDLIKGLNLYTLSGQKLQSLSVFEVLASLDLQGYAAGVYYLEIELEDGRILREKLLKE